MAGRLSVAREDVGEEQPEDASERGTCGAAAARKGLLVSGRVRRIDVLGNSGGLLRVAAIIAREKRSAVFAFKVRRRFVVLGNTI